MDQSNGRPCRLTVTGLQYPPRTQGLERAFPADAEPLTTVQEVEARYFQKGGSHYLFYEEQPEGYPEILKTRVKLKGNRVEIQRRGTMGNSMVFEAGKRYQTEYGTPFGTLLLEIVTHSVEIGKCGFPAEQAAPEAVEWPGVKIRYGLEERGEPLGEYELRIERR
ncbi:MAG: DUF1934 domain-containing protein [Muribaculum sp.]|nr:DUF1934 domain-containing protein [Muribaculum sp.]